MEKLLRSFLIIGLVMLAAPALFAQPAPVAPAGSGESHDPYLIYSLEELYWISQNPEEWAGKYYQQMSDIDASATVNWNGDEGWEPIGNSDDHFYGRYDGRGYTISGLYINRQEEHQALFGLVYASYASISNLGLVNVNITGGDRYTGALAGLIYGNVDNCYSTGKVSEKAMLADWWVE